MAHKMGLAEFSLQNKNIWTSKKYLDKSGSTYSYVWIEDSTVVTGNSSRTFSSPIAYAGTGYKYYVIVKKSTNTTVTTTKESAFANADVPDNSWSETVNIAEGKFTSRSKTPDMTCKTISKHTLAVGDILYSDGALSASHTGSIHRTPIGLVFYLGTTSYDKSVNAKFTHGYVMALKYSGGAFTSPTIWCTGTWQTTIATDGLLTPRSGTGLAKDACDIITTQTGDAQRTFRINAIRNDMEGLKHCKYALQKSTTAMTAILKAQNHQSYAPVPTSSTNTTAGTVTLQSPITSGWYLPSIGQCYQWMNTCSTSITGSEAVNYRELGSGTDYTKDFFITKAESMPSISESTACERVCKEITAYLNGKGLTGFYSYLHPTAGNRNFWWWTSTENFADHMFVFNCDGTHIYMDGRYQYAPKNKENGTYGVMSVLVF